LPEKLFLNCLKKLKFFKNLPKQIDIFSEIAWKNRNIFDPDPRHPQISNQIDAAVK